MRVLVCMISTVGLVSLPAYAQTAEEQGLAIAVEADQRDRGWGDATADMTMILRNRQGETSERRLRVRTLEVEGDGDKSMTIFDHPADVNGTAFLSHTHATEADDQWLYLPALKRVKRIASANKSGPFVGSEFAYEDISSQEIAKYQYKYLRDEALGGQDAFVVERIPQYRHSGYTRQVVWLDKEHYRVLKGEYFDRKGAHLKTLFARDYRQYLGKYWRAHTMEMVNHQNGKSTVLSWSKFQFGNGFSERDFERNSLKRVK